MPYVVEGSVYCVLTGPEIYWLNVRVDNSTPE